MKKPKKCDISADNLARRATDHGLLAYSVGTKKMMEIFNLGKDNNRIEQILDFLAQKYNDLMIQGNLGECREIIEDMILVDQEFEYILKNQLAKARNSTL